MPRHHRRATQEMAGSGVLEAPQMVAVEAGHQEQLKLSHVKVDDRYFGIDPNADFNSSSINVEYRKYVSDQAPTPNAPISFTQMPQFNVFRSLSESFFVFQVSLSGTVKQAGEGVGQSVTIYAPKPYFSSLFITDLTINLNNVNVSDQHSSTCHYAHFIKTIMFDANLKSPSACITEAFNVSGGTTTVPYPLLTYGVSGDDARTITEGIINTDWINGLTTLQSIHGIFLSDIDGSEDNQSFSANAAAIEITYRPRDGVWLSPKYIVPGVLENFILRVNSADNIFQCGNGVPTFTGSIATANSYAELLWNDFSIASNSNVVMNIVSASYYEKQLVCTQSTLRSYQSLISMQPVYMPVVSANTFLVPIPAGQNSVSLQNVLSGRVPNLIVVGALNQNPNSAQNSSIVPVANRVAHQFKTYSPILAKDTSTIYQTCLTSVRLTVNGRLYPHLYSINCASGSNQDLTMLYEMYKQGCLIRDVDNRGNDQSNNTLNYQYKMDNPLLSFGEFRSNFTYFVYNIRRNGDLPQNSGDKEVGGLDILATFDQSKGNSPSGNSQLLVCGISSDSLMSTTDGGSTTSFVY